jgi:hypothetical protein
MFARAECVVYGLGDGYSGVGTIVRCMYKEWDCSVKECRVVANKLLGTSRQHSLTNMELKLPVN